MKKSFFFIPFISIVMLYISCKTDVVPPPEFDQYAIDSTLTLLTKLPLVVDESSGIIKVGNEIWTNNDSGDNPNIYHVDDKSDQLIRTLTLTNAHHQDWEDLAQDNEFIYIGDFGNNGGNREDLMIYKFPKTALSNTETMVSDTLFFNYTDQLSFDNDAYAHDFDCESMIATAGQLFLFTKNFDDQKTRVYGLPTNAGNYPISPIDSFNVDGNLTAAGIDKTNNVLALLGYNVEQDSRTYFPFVWLFWDYEGTNFFKGKHRRLNFPQQQQMEGICFYGDGKFLISSEVNGFSGGELFLLDYKQWIK